MCVFVCVCVCDRRVGVVGWKRWWEMCKKMRANMGGGLIKAQLPLEQYWLPFSQNGCSLCFAHKRHCQHSPDLLQQAVSSLYSSRLFQPRWSEIHKLERCDVPQHRIPTAKGRWSGVGGADRSIPENANRYDPDGHLEGGGGVYTFFYPMQNHHFRGRLFFFFFFLFGADFHVHRQRLICISSESPPPHLSLAPVVFIILLQLG